MAKVFGEPGPEAGDQLVSNLVRRLDDEWIVYQQPNIVYRQMALCPDYVLIHKDIGVVVLEVKDRANIVKITSETMFVYRNGRYEEEKSPVLVAKTYVHAIVNRLQENDDLRNHAGKLDFPYRYAAVFPLAHGDWISQMRRGWGDYVLGYADLQSVEAFIRAVKSIPIPGRRWKLPLTDCQIDAIRATIRPELEIKGGKGVYDIQQEEEAFKPLPKEEEEAKQGIPPVVQRMLWLEQQVPEESREITKAYHVRLLRGYAGTGKTDVLVLRALYLYQNYPDKQILVTTFNKPLVNERLKLELGNASDRVDVRTFASLCMDIREAKNYEKTSPQNTEGVLNHLATEGSPEIRALIEKYGIDFLGREIQWIQEVGVERRDAYLGRERTGLGGFSKRRLTKEMKAEVFSVFEAYQQELHSLPAIDWHDLYNQAARILAQGTPPPKLYDAILVDEAQHFAPLWIQTLCHLLKPDGHLFLADDPSQGIYRNYSWRERGIEVRGHTRWLRIPYRHTRQITAILSALLESDPNLLALLQQEQDFETMALNHPGLREGEKPELHEFSTFVEEVEYMKQRIQEIQDRGVIASEIAIVHPEKHVRQKFDGLGVRCVDPVNQTGMEYRVVIIPQVQLYFRRNSVADSWEESRLKNLQRFYVAASRAREMLLLSYSRSGKSDGLPKELQSILSAVEYQRERDESTGCL